MKTVYCPYCGKKAAYIDSKVVYGKSYGKIYYCQKCDAYVGVHKGTDNPLGRLANKSLRYWKRAAHAAFDPLWQSGRFTRNGAYFWLSQRMGLPVSETHIGMFDVAECKRAIQIIKEEPNAKPDIPHGAAHKGR